MKNIFLVAFFFLLFPNVSFGQKTFTKDQLNHMIQNENYPEQGKVTKTTTKEAEFSHCKLVVESIMAQIRDEYPVRTVVDTSMIYMVKAWTNDGSIVATCSSKDKKMVVTQAAYK